MSTGKTLEAAVLFADVCGSTRLYERYGDAIAKQAIDACLGVCRAAVESAGGRVVKTIGDEVMCVLPTAHVAAQAAVEMQRNVESGVSGAQVPLSIRVGFHAGSMIEAADGDVFGDAVNVAARMAAQAKAAQIVTTETTIAECGSDFQGRSRKFDMAPIKGKTGEIGLFDLQWQSADADADNGSVTQMVTSAANALRSISMLLRLQYQDRKETIDSGLTPITIGRESRCDLLVASPYSSRTHARIEYRRGKFIYVDQSTNGSYVVLIESDGNQLESFVKREEFTLIGRGLICLGEPSETGMPHAIRFEVD